MEAALDLATARGHDAVWLQVWEENARARRFYEKCGLRAVGGKPFLFGDVLEQDIVYARALAEIMFLNGPTDSGHPSIP